MNESQINPTSAVIHDLNVRTLVLEAQIEALTELLVPEGDRRRPDFQRRLNDALARLLARVPDVPGASAETRALIERYG